MFKVMIEQMIGKDIPNEVIDTFSFDTKKEANKKKRELKKELSLVSHGYHIVNYKTMKELTTNY